jgi:hypothetical protein
MLQIFLQWVFLFVPKKKGKQNASKGGKSDCPQKGFRSVQKNVSHIQV